MTWIRSSRSTAARPRSRNHDGIARIVLAGGLALLALGCNSPTPATTEGAARSTAESVRAPELTLHPESLALEDGGTLAYDRGVIAVPMRRGGDPEKTIDVEFVRFRATTDAGRDVPPIVQLRGGPGPVRIMEQLAQPGYYEALLAPYARIADVVVVGQRGFGTSGATPCDPRAELTFEETKDETILNDAIDAGMRACQAKWEAAGLDLQGFNIEQAADDVADIARALDYGSIQLRGVSFGAHWGIAVMRRHPDLVTRATLASMEGPDHTYDAPTPVLDTLARIAAAAEASEQLAGRIPEGGLIAAYERFIASVAEQPVVVEVEHPETGAPLHVTVDDEIARDIFRLLRGATTFRFRTVSWPVEVLAMIDGDRADATQRWLNGRLRPGLRNAAWYMMDCSSGISPARLASIQGDPAAALLGPSWRFYEDACRSWDADLGADFRGPFTTSIPTLIIQGNWDVGTPYENALELLPSFTNHHFIHIEGGSHGALREAYEGVDGFRDAVGRWMATGRFDGLPERVDLGPLDWRTE